MKRRVQVEHGAVLRRAAEVQRVFGEKPFVDGALFWMLDRVGGAVGERFPDGGSQQECDLPSHMAGDGVLRGQDYFGDVRNGRHGKTFGLESLFDLSEKSVEQ